MTSLKKLVPRAGFEPVLARETAGSGVTFPTCGSADTSEKARKLTETAARGPKQMPEPSDAFPGVSWLRPIAPEQRREMADGTLALDRLSSVPLASLLGARAFYVGWDGRLVKFGVSRAATGLVTRLKGYWTHNPTFRLLVVVAADEPLSVEAQYVREHYDSRAFDGGRRDAEWFYPTDSVVATVRTLVAVAMAAAALAADEIDPDQAEAFVIASKRGGQ